MSVTGHDGRLIAEKEHARGWVLVLVLLPDWGIWVLPLVGVAHPAAMGCLPPSALFCSAHPNPSRVTTLCSHHFLKVDLLSIAIC